MTLAELLVAERTRLGLDAARLAAALGAAPSEIAALEAGTGEAEAAGALVAEVAIALGVPMSRFVAETGRASDYQPGNCGRLTRRWREERALTLDALAESAGVPREALAELESGSGPAERWLPLLLGVAQELDQPLFNFFYPYGVPLRSLEVA